MALMQEELKKVDEGKYPLKSILGARSSFHAQFLELTDQSDLIPAIWGR